MKKLIEFIQHFIKQLQQQEDLAVQIQIFKIYQQEQSLENKLESYLKQKMEKYL